MQRMILFTAALCAATGLGVSVALAKQRATLPTAATHGRQVFIADGCPQCHGLVGEGSVGPRLAPGPLPFEIFAHQLRNPIGVMPVYTAKILSQADLGDIYAYVSGIPKAKTVATIPLLN